MFLEGVKKGCLYFTVKQESVTNPSLVISKLDPRLARPADLQHAGARLHEEPNTLEEGDQFWKYQ